MTLEERHALKMIADGRNGVTEAVLATHGLAGHLLTRLVSNGLTSVESETIWAGGEPIEVVRVRITDSGWRALAG